MLVALSALSSGVPVKPMNIASGRSCFMAVVHLAGLGAVGLVDEDEQVALGLEVLRASWRSARR
ncbi:MAG: hypothetical protein V9G13_08105 [Marmoricola sp.]